MESWDGMCNYCQSVERPLNCQNCNFERLKTTYQPNRTSTEKQNQIFIDSFKGPLLEKEPIMRVLKHIQERKGQKHLDNLAKQRESLKNILHLVKDKRNSLKQSLQILKDRNSYLNETIQESKSRKLEEKKKNQETIIQKIQVVRNAFNIHHVFPSLNVPLRLKIVQDHYFEATQVGVVESQFYSLDLSGFGSLKGINPKHSKMICEVLCRTAELVAFLASIQFINLPVKMKKSNGAYHLSFQNDESKTYKLYFDQNTPEKQFFQAVSLLFTNFMYINKIMNVKLNIPINLENEQKNDILNLNPILDKLTEVKGGVQPSEFDQSDIPLDVIHLGRRSDSFENEFEVIEDLEFLDDSG